MDPTYQVGLELSQTTIEIILDETVKMNFK